MWSRRGRRGGEWLDPRGQKTTSTVGPPVAVDWCGRARETGRGGGFAGQGRVWAGFWAGVWAGPGFNWAGPLGRPSPVFIFFFFFSRFLIFKNTFKSPKILKKLFSSIL